MLKKKRLIATLVHILLATSAQAADTVGSNTHDWSGPYVSGFLSSTFDTKSVVGFCAGRNGVACGSDEYEVNLGTELSDAAHADQSVIAGVEIGFNKQYKYPAGYQWLPNLLGLEAEIGLLDYYETIAGMTEIDPVAAPSGRIPQDIDYETHLNTYVFLGAVQVMRLAKG